MNVRDVYFPKKVNFFNAKNSSKICDIELAQLAKNCLEDEEDLDEEYDEDDDPFEPV